MGASFSPCQKAAVVRTEPFPHPMSGFSSTRGLFLHQRARLAQLPTERRDTRPHGSTVTLSLPSSSGSLLLGTKLILPSSCSSRALWIGSNRIPPDSKFRTASRASLPNTLGSFSWVSAWLCSPSYPNPHANTEHTSGNPKAEKGPEEGGNRKSECLLNRASAVTKATEAAQFQGALSVLSSQMCSSLDSWGQGECFLAPLNHPNHGIPVM